MNNDKYNKQRKRMLEEMDNGEKISNIELGMYDLTPYFDRKVQDASLSESIMLNKNEERKITHTNSEIFFSPPQSEALKYLINHDRVILSAPTSFGKTLLVKEYIFKYRPKKVIYIVPTNALAYELEKSFKENENFSDYQIYDKCSDKSSNNKGEMLLFIGTQEKYLELDSRELSDIDLFIIDEAYKLKETTKCQRSYKLSETFLDSLTKKSKKVFLLTPNAKIKGFERYEFNVYESNLNVVEKKYTIVNEDSFYDTLINIGRKHKTILFCKNPEQIENAYRSIEPYTKDNNITNLVKYLEEEVHPDWSVIKLLKAGILTHHGQMPKYIQNKMIKLFNTGNEYNLLFGTNSISEGINTLTKNVFIHPKAKPEENVLLLKNTIGRAGRLGVYPVGHIYSVHNIESMVKEETIIELAISNDEEFQEIESGKNSDKINELSICYGLEFEFCKELLKNYKISLNRLRAILESLKTNIKYHGIGNLPYLASIAYPDDYKNINYNDEGLLIRGYLQFHYIDNNNNYKRLDNFNDRIEFFKSKSKNSYGNSEIINMYMRFIYSSLEYYIMPLVNIGLEIHDNYPNWVFGDNVYASLDECKSRYLSKTFGYLDYDNLSDSHRLIINALRDYGITSELKNINESILCEIEENLKIRYSTYDVLKVIERLSNNSETNGKFYYKIMRKYVNM